MKKVNYAAIDIGSNARAVIDKECKRGRIARRIIEQSSTDTYPPQVR